jgi:CheY-like chemotaxis protein
MGGLDIIAMRMTDERMKRIAETALEAARRGAKLTGQLLAFSRIQRISMTPVAVNGVIANMQDLLRHTIGTTITIETRLAPEVIHGICDPNQLENAILNLAINARDAMPDGGTLTISTARTSVSSDPELELGDYICVSVADTGEGMPPDVIARAIEPFFSTKPLGKGTGLGLAQVYGIARQSGGTIRIESEVGKGTVVHLLLAAAAAADAADRRETPEARPKIAPAGERSASILVIDDDSEVRAFLADSLEGLGYSVIEAEDGETGLKQLEQIEPDLLLLDYAMPGMSGADVARAARKQRPHVPIVFVTGYAESEQLEAALGPEVPVLRKPFSLGQLAAAVEERIASKSQPEVPLEGGKADT